MLEVGHFRGQLFYHIFLLAAPASIHNCVIQLAAYVRLAFVCI